MSKPTLTLEFSDKAYLAFSSSSLFRILVLLALEGDLSVSFFSNGSNSLVKLRLLTTEPIPLGEVAFQAILALNLSLFSLSS